MTDYSDIPQVNTLYNEQQLLRNAISYLETGGGLTQVMVAPPPSGSPTMQMSVSITLLLPTLPQLVEDTILAFQARDDQITQQLVDLGVTPPAREPLP